MSALFSPPGSCRKASFPIPRAYAQGGAPSFAPPLRPFFHGINSPNRRYRTKCVWTVAALEISTAAVALLRARWRMGLCDRIVGTGRRCLLDPGRQSYPNAGKPRLQVTSIELPETAVTQFAK